MTGMLLALEAWPKSASQDDRPLVSEAVFTLYEAWSKNRERLFLVDGDTPCSAGIQP